MGYREVYQDSLQDPVAFWGAAVKSITWDVEPSRVLDVEAAPLLATIDDPVILDEIGAALSGMRYPRSGS